MEVGGRGGEFGVGLAKLVKCSGWWRKKGVGLEVGGWRMEEGKGKTEKRS